MTWTELFERAEAFEVSESDVCAILRERRDG